MLGAAQSILEFEEHVANDKENQDDAVTRAAIALLGDLAANLPNSGPLFQNKAWVQELLGQVRSPTVCTWGLMVAALLGYLAAKLRHCGPLLQNKAWVQEVLGQMRRPACVAGQ